MQQRISRLDLPPEVSYVVSVLLEFFGIACTIFEVATNRMGVLWYAHFYRDLQSNPKAFDNVMDYVSIVIGFVPIVCLFILAFMFLSGFYERKKAIHTQQLKNEFDRLHVAMSRATFVVQVIVVILLIIICLYGLVMDVVGVYSFFGAPAQSDGRFAQLIAGGIFAALMSTLLGQVSISVGISMWKHASHQRNSHKVDVQNRTQVPRTSGLLQRGAKAVKGVGSGQQIAAPSGRQNP